MVNKKTALVFGSTGGIGSVVVDFFKCWKYQLGLFSRHQPTCQKKKTISCSGDVRSAEQVQKFVEDVISQFGRIDVVVNCVGIIESATIQETTTARFEEIWRTNTVGTFNILKAVYNTLVQQKFGHVFLISSLRSHIPGKGKAAYCASKAGMNALADVFRLETESANIRTTVINPGFVDTDWYGEDTQRPYYGQNPIPITQPQDIVEAIQFILDLSPGAYVNEVNIGEVFGGREGIQWKKK